MVSIKPMASLFIGKIGKNSYYYWSYVWTKANTGHSVDLKGELYSNYFFLYFALIGLKWDSVTLFTKISCFILPKLTFELHLHQKNMAFYLLT